LGNGTGDEGKGFISGEEPLAYHPKTGRLTGLSNHLFGESKAMNILRIKIIGFWLLFVLFWLLLYFCWRYRFLWVALFPAAIVFLELITAKSAGWPTNSLLSPALSSVGGGEGEKPATCGASSRPISKPRRRSSMPPRIETLLWLLVIEWVLIVIVHGILYPHSAGLYLLAKLVLVATSAPLLYYKIRLDYKAWLDYGAFRAAQNPSAEPGAPPNAGSAGAPPASVS